MKKHKIVQLLLSKNHSGGNVYENYLSLLQESVDITQIALIEDSSEKRIQKLIHIFSTLNYYAKNIYLQTDITIRNLAAIWKLSKEKKDIIIFHHYDPEAYPFLIQFYQKFLFSNLLKNSHKINIVVVVSHYWKRYLQEKGIHSDKIKIIYNPFQIEKYIQKSPSEIQKFKEKYKLENKPIIYIGNPQKIKGADIAYESLRKLDVHLVSSGKNYLSLPCTNLQLSFDEYITLLQASTLVVLMSQFKEGWNRVAHEAILCKTPVIGSGEGGMSELLSDSKQIICPHEEELFDSVQELLLNPEKLEQMAQDGHFYAKQFTLDNFQDAWIECFETLKEKSSS